MLTMELTHSVHYLLLHSIDNKEINVSVKQLRSSNKRLYVSSSVHAILTPLLCKCIRDVYILMLMLVLFMEGTSAHFMVYRHAKMIYAVVYLIKIIWSVNISEGCCKHVVVIMAGTMYLI